MLTEARMTLGSDLRASCLARYSFRRDEPSSGFEELARLELRMKFLCGVFVRRTYSRAVRVLAVDLM